MNFNPFKSKENIDSIEVEKETKIKEVLSFVKDLANDSIFEHTGRKDYHVSGTDPVNLLDKISRPLMGLSGYENIDKARLELVEIVQKILSKAEEVKSEDTEKIRNVLNLLNDPDLFTNSKAISKIADEISLLKLEEQVTVNRNEDNTKIIEKQDPWEKPDPTLN